MDTFVLAMLQRYLSGRIGLDDLQLFLADLTWEPAGRDPGAVKAALALEAPIAEFTGGHISERELQDALREEAGLHPTEVTMESFPAVQPRGQAWFSGSETTTRIREFA